jgi:hypothetical protein
MHESVIVFRWYLFGRQEIITTVFFETFIQASQAMSIEVKLITTDETHRDKDGSVFDKTRIPLITAPSSQSDIPDNVCPETLAVTCDDTCHLPMTYKGCVEGGHEFKCGAEPRQCSRDVWGLVGARSRGRIAPDGRQTWNRPAAEFARRRALLQGKTDATHHANVRVCNVL